MQQHYNILQYITIITLQQCSILTLNLNQHTQSPLNISPVTQFPLWRQDSRGAQPICMGPDGAASRREPGCSCGPWQARSDKVPFGSLTSTIYIYNNIIYIYIYSIWVYTLYIYTHACKYVCICIQYILLES